MKKNVILIVLPFIFLYVFAEDFSVLVEKAVENFRNKNYTNAAQLLNQAMQTSPSPEIAFNIREELGYAIFLEMLSNNMLKEYVTQLLDLADIYQKQQMRDPEYITQLVEALKRDFYSRWIDWNKSDSRKSGAIEELGAVGPYALKWLFPLIKGENVEYRSYAIRAIIAMRKYATFPIIEFIKSSDPTLRKTGFFILGELKDRRALPYLKYFYEKENLPIIKESIIKICSKKPSEIEDAKTLFISQICRLMLKPDYTLQLEAKFLNGRVWSFSNNKLTARDYPVFLYNIILAEKMARDAVKYLGKNLLPIYLLVETYKWTLVKDIIKENTEKGNEELVSKLKNLSSKYGREVPSTILLAGPQAIIEAARLAINKHQYKVGGVLLSYLGEVGNEKLLGKSKELPPEKIKIKKKTRSIIIDSFIVYASTNRETLQGKNLLKEFIESEIPIIRYNCVLSILQFVSSKGFEDDDKLIPVVIEILNTQKLMWIRRTIKILENCRGIEDFYNIKLIEKLEDLLLKDNISVDLKVAIINLLTKFKKKRSLNLFVKYVLKKSIPVKLKIALLKGIKSMNIELSSSQINKLSTLLSDPNNKIKFLVASILGRSNIKPDISLLYL